MLYKISLFFISLYLIIAPFILLPEIGYYDSKRVLQLILFTLLGLLVIISIYKHSKNQESRDLDYKKLQFNQFVGGLSILLIASGFVSVLLNFNFNYSFLEYTFSLLLLAGMIVLIPLSLRDQYRLGQVVFITALLYSGLYLIVFFGNYISSFQDQLIPLWPDRLSFTIILDDVEYIGKEVLYFVHRRFFNHTQTWTLPLLVGILLYFKSRKPKDWIIHVLLFLLIAFWWMLIFASGARGTFVSIIAALLFIALIFGKTVIPYVKYSFGTAIAGILFYFLLFRLITTDQAPMVRTTDSGRGNMWERAMDLWLQEPIFGIGPLHYAEIINSMPYFAHPHNFYIQFLTEWGLIAFLALIGLMIIAARMVVKNYNRIPRKSANKLIYIAFVWSISAALLHASLSGVMHTPMSQVWFILIGAWLLGYLRYKEPEDTKYALGFYGSRIVFIILLCAVLFVSINEIAGISNGYMEYMNKYPGSSFFSRFWEQGLFE